MKSVMGFVLVALLAFAAASARPARADVDMTGSWNVYTFGLDPFCLDFVQTGTALVGHDCAVASNDYTGTIDPLTGAFFVAQPPGSVCTPFGCCPDGYCELDATAAADSQTFSGSLLCYVARISGCATAEFPVGGARIVCGDSTVGIGEQCDDGNTVGGDCCSPTCQLESGICDDGDPCTDGETCSAGVCGGGSPACELEPFKCYEAKDLKDPRFVSQTVTTVDQVVDESVDLTQPELVCNAVAVAGAPVNDADAHLTCYHVRGEPLPPATDVEIGNQLGTSRLRLLKPKLLCVPSTVAP